MTTQLLVALILLARIAPPPPSEPASPAGAAPVQEAGPNDLGQRSMDELIDMLPPAGCEWRWDHATNTGVEDSVSRELESRLASGTTLTDEQWRRALIATGAIRLRSRWPVGHEYLVAMTVPGWLGVAQIRVAPQAEGMHLVQVGELLLSWSGTMAAVDARDARRGLRVGFLPADCTELGFDVEVERGQSWKNWMQDGDEAKPGLLWRGTLSTPIQIVESTNQLALPTDSDLVRKAVLHSIGAGFRDWGPSGQRVPFMLVDPDCSKDPFLTTTGLDLRVELVRDGEVFAASWLVATDIDTLMLTSSICKSPRRFYGSTNFDVPAEHVEHVEDWMVRVSGTTEHVEYLWNAESYWSGTVTVPWRDLVENERERAPQGRGPECSTPYFRSQ